MGNFGECGSTLKALDMGLFKKRNQRISENTLAGRIENYLDRKQRKLADYLNIKTKNVSAAGVLMALVVFCLLVGSYLLWVLANAFGAFQ
mgnify:FL=1